MLKSIEGFWISASVLTGDFSLSYFHTFHAPGPDVYATIALSEVNHYPTEPDMRRRALGYIAHWTSFDLDGRLVAPETRSMGHTQNAVLVRNCGSLEFHLDVSNWVEATAQINIFEL